MKLALGKLMVGLGCGPVGVALADAVYHAREDMKQELKAEEEAKAAEESIDIVDEPNETVDEKAENEKKENNKTVMQIVKSLTHKSTLNALNIAAALAYNAFMLRTEGLRYIARHNGNLCREYRLRFGKLQNTLYSVADMYSCTAKTEAKEGTIEWDRLTSKGEAFAEAANAVGNILGIKRMVTV